MRFYGYRRAEVLREPVRSFWALLAAIPQLSAEEDRRALMIAGIGSNPGENGKSYRALMDALDEQAGIAAAAASPAEPPIKPGMPGVTEVETGTLSAARLERAAKAQEVKRQWLERLGRKVE